MDFILHSVNLFCSDLNRQMSFLSFLFDVEIRFEGGLRFFTLGGARFNLYEASGSGETPIAPFELSASDPQDLKNLKQKLQLYAYKNQLEDINCSLGSSCLEFEDPCGNLWKVNAPGQATHRTDPHKVLM